MAIEQPEYVVERYLRRLGEARPEPTTLGFYAAIDAMRAGGPVRGQPRGSRARRPAVEHQADRQRELLRRWPSSRRWATCSPTSTPRATPGHRFYAGCDNVDAIESHGAELARDAVRRRARLPAAALGHRRQPGRVPGDPRHARRETGCSSGSASRTSRRCRTSSSGTLRARAATTSGCSAWTTTRAATSPTATGFNISARLFDARSYTRRPRDRPARPRRGARAAARGPAADPARRLQRVPAQDRLRADAGDRRRGRRHVHGRHGALRGPRRRQGVHRRLRPGAARARRHDHHPQDPARPARRDRAVRATEYADAVDKGCPAGARRPAAARHGGQGGGAAGGRRSPTFADYAARIVDNAPRAGRRRCSGTARASRRAARTTTSCSSTSPRRSGSPAARPRSALRAVGMTLNRNSLPFDVNGPWYTSGLRLGTPALTTLGMGAAEIEEIAEVMTNVLRATTPVASTASRARRSTTPSRRPRPRPGRGSRRCARSSRSTPRSTSRLSTLRRDPPRNTRVTRRS